ncbi:MAG: hypothetical protein OXK16_12625 [bacterium]|nr:hypothetical protein [bacterium]
MITSAGVIILSVQGVPIRLMDVDAWTLVFVRGVLSAPGLFVFFLVLAAHSIATLRSLDLAARPTGRGVHDFG